MINDYGIAENVLNFISSSAEMVGKIESSRWSQNAYCEVLECGMGSPIEHLFYVSTHAQCLSEFVPFNPDPTFDENNNLEILHGICVTPQYKLGKYRADFLVQQFGVGPREILSPVIVELDGHAFHDRDKYQRSYEKRRDRDFLRAGFRVVHFTGSDVVSDPYAVAFEVLEMLGVFAGSCRTYDAANPLGEL